VPVRELGHCNADDREIFAQARSAGAVVIRKDRDFLHLLFEQGPPPQVIWLRVGNSSNQALQAVLPRTLGQALALLWAGSTASPGVHIATLSGMFGLSALTSTRWSRGRSTRFMSSIGIPPKSNSLPSTIAPGKQRRLRKRTSTGPT
jgi:predicted nuclease of predicted toxin-antitoxin system